MTGIVGEERVGVLLVCLLLLAGQCVGQQHFSRLADFENVTVDSATNRVYYEQRLYRNPVIGLLDLRDALKSPAGTEFVPLFQGVPIAAYRLTPSWQTTLLTASERRMLARSQPYRYYRYKFDFRIQPEVIANFGFKLDPFQTKTSLLLQTQLYLTRGLVLNVGLVFPLGNNYDNQALNVRPAPIFLHQFLALGEQDFLSGSAGLFYNNQYGVHLQYRRANLTRPWSVGVESSLTGYYYFPTTGIYYEGLKNMMLLADVAYRMNRRDITLKVSGGQFLYSDRGARLDFIRQFGSVDVGLYATKTTKGSTAGFNFAIPIPPGKLAQGKRVRLRSSEEFRWEYTYNGSGANLGDHLRAGHQLDVLLRQYHSGYLSKQLN